MFDLDNLFTILPELRDAQENNKPYFVNTTIAKDLVDALTATNQQEQILLDKIQFVVNANTHQWNSRFADGRNIYGTQIDTLLTMIDNAIETEKQNQVEFEKFHN